MRHGFARGAGVPASLVALLVGFASCTSDDGGAQPGGTAGNAGHVGGTPASAGKGGKSGGGGSHAGTAGTDGGTSGGDGGDNGGGVDSGGTSGASEAGTGGAAGSETSDTTDGYVNGSRLRAVVEVAGNAKRFVAWHDTELDIECTFSLDAQGTERCLPGYGGGYTVYGDDQCEELFVVYGEEDVAPRYVVDPEYEFACGVGPRYLAVGATTDTVVDFYYPANGDCLLSGHLDADSVVAELGAPVAETLFAAAETQREARGSRVEANVRRAGDGAREVASFYDLERKAECNPLEHAGAGYACVPWDRAYIQTYFADDGCETPAAYHPGYAQQVCGREPKIVQESAPFATDTFFEVGPLIDEAVYQDNGSCVPYEPPAELYATYYAVGEAVPWTDLAPLVSTNEGSGRILQNTLRVPSGAVVARLDFYDTTLATFCDASLAADSTTRCLPRTYSSVNVFADADCTEGLLALPSDAEVPIAGTFLSAYDTSGTTSIFSVGPEISEPAQIWQLNGLACEPGAVVPDQDWYAADSHAPSEFVPVTRERE